MYAYVCFKPLDLRMLEYHVAHSKSGCSSFLSSKLHFIVSGIRRQTHQSSASLMRTNFTPNHRPDMVFDHALEIPPDLGFSSPKLSHQTVTEHILILVH